MKAEKHETYRSETPETFNFELLDSPKLAAIGSQLASSARVEIQGHAPDKRVNLPGIRMALRLIAGTADL